MKSIQRFVEEGQQKPTPGTEANSSERKTNWVELYQRGDTAGSVAALSENLAKSTERPESARLYNDRGYARYDVPGQTEAALRDLDHALDLHHVYLALTLSNLAVAAIDTDDFSKAIQYLNDALLLTHGKESIGASYLRVRLLPGHLMFARHEKWEQHPANVIEAAYINLAYAVTKLQGYEASLEVLQEGLELLPSSVRLKHALARWHLSQRRAALADPIYEELLGLQVGDPNLRREIEAYRTVGQKGRRRS